MLQVCIRNRCSHRGGTGVLMQLENGPTNDKFLHSITDWSARESIEKKEIACPMYTLPSLSFSLPLSLTLFLVAVQPKTNAARFHLGSNEREKAQLTSDCRMAHNGWRHSDANASQVAYLAALTLASVVCKIGFRSIHEQSTDNLCLSFIERCKRRSK